MKTITKRQVAAVAFLLSSSCFLSLACATIEGARTSSVTPEQEARARKMDAEITKRRDDAARRRADAKEGDCLGDAFATDHTLGGRAFRLVKRVVRIEGIFRKADDVWQPCLGAEVARPAGTAN